MLATTLRVAAAPCGARRARSAARSGLRERGGQRLMAMHPSGTLAPVRHHIPTEHHPICLQVKVAKSSGSSAPSALPRGDRRGLAAGRLRKVHLHGARMLCEPARAVVAQLEERLALGHGLFIGGVPAAEGGAAAAPQPGWPLWLCSAGCVHAVAKGCGLSAGGVSPESSEHRVKPRSGHLISSVPRGKAAGCAARDLSLP